MSSSGITFSGFNSIDFNVVINAVMAQASQPLTALQTKQTGLQSQLSQFSALSSKVAAVQAAADGLSSDTALANYAAAVSDSTVLTATTSSDSIAGRYSIQVDQLAQAQVTASGTVSDAATTIVADDGSLTINGKEVRLSSGMTLQGLAKAINGTDGIGVAAAVVQTGASAFRLVLTGTATGEANAFTVSNTLTLGGAASPLTFSGSNSVDAVDAKLTVNNVAISSASNTVSSAVPGTTMTLLKKTTSPTIVDVTADTSALSNKLQSFITAYNGLMKFASDQGLAAVAGNPASIARDPALRAVRDTLRHTIASQFGSTTPSYLSEIGVEFTRTGTLNFNPAQFALATKNGTASLKRLLVGSGGTTPDGVFSTVGALLKQYTQSAGVITQSQDRINKQISRLDDQMASLQRRLDVQRASLVREYAAADAAMSSLKNQSGSLSTFQTSTSGSTSKTA